MAENKKSFVLYTDLIHTLTHLAPEEQGDLFMHILKYVNGKNVIISKLSLKLEIVAIIFCDAVIVVSKNVVEEVSFVWDSIIFVA